MALKTIPDVEICRIGRWNGVGGEFEITTEHFRDAVVAATDPEVDRPRVKFGHDSPLNGLGDGAPQYGWVANPRVSEDGKSLRADLVDVPESIAGLIGTAYRQRSIEMRLGVTTASGKKYAAAISGLALLGATPPAVKGMEDLVPIYASADHAEDAGTVTITFSDAARHGEADTTYTGDVTEKNPAQADKPGATETTEENAAMAFLENVREALGLDENATEDDVLAAVKAAADAKTEAPAETPKTEDAPKADEKVEDKEEEKVAASEATPKVVTLSEGKWTEVQSELAELAKFREERATAEREALVTDAISKGKIAKDERDSWLVALSEAPEVSRNLLSSIPGERRFSVEERGTSNAQTTESGQDDGAEAAANIRNLFQPKL